MEIEGARVLVTGGSQRVGKAIVEALARRRAQVLIHYRSAAEKALELVNTLRSDGITAEAVRADLTRLSDLDNLINKLDSIDILVNNAAIFPRTPLAQLTTDVWDATLDTNLRGPTFLAARLGLKMKKRGRGVIINITDCGVQRPYKNYLAYLISKAGLEMATRALAIELAPEVRVVAIAPGTVLPPEGGSGTMLKALSEKAILQKLGGPDHIARAVLFAIENDFLTGTTITVDGGTTLR